MKSQEFPSDAESAPKTPAIQKWQIEGREWWLWGLAVLVTLVLTAGIISLTFFQIHPQYDGTYWADLKEWVRGLACVVLLFDIYTLYQHMQLQRMRRQLAERDQLFQLITENAADMIAVVDGSGKRIYNSPAYERILGYSAAELRSTSSIEQIHPEDRQRVIEAAKKAHSTGTGERLEYRIRHKDGSWRILESTASAVKNVKGETEKLVIVNRDISERKRAEEKLAHNSFHDGLTNLPNRALFIERLQRAFVLGKRHADYKFAVLFIDIDEFKVFNDSLGHSVGDELLVQIGQRLTASLRELDTISRVTDTGKSTSDDTLARLGGDEYTVLLEEIRNASDAIRVAERLQSRLAPVFTVNGHEVVVTASIGIALSTAQCEHGEDLLRDANIAMYRAKRLGKARCEVFDAAMHANAVRRLELETELRKGLELREFRTHYQPIISLQNGRITGFEALTRWQRRERLLMPGEFITVADETGLIIPMNRVLLQEACEQLRSWHTQFPSQPPLTMSVNITSKEFAHPDLAKGIAQTLQATGLDPSVLQLEITETIAMGDPEKAASVLAELKTLGVRLSVDDFGTGYSSLSRLQQFPVDSLKIDRAFISQMDRDVEIHKIVQVIIMLAQTLGLATVAEGTETEAQVNQLKELACGFAQGYYFSKPADPVVITELLLKVNGAKVHKAAAGA
ncbi:MAG TPA: EAL domain-containing protein [Terriglobales bacterium]|jgi:diguanylate cyclase (GGDEF)-like protein/PAS domain S-box-containing protein|nr:EAL domain-containing protein [Terriglobales bacterium]